MVPAGHVGVVDVFGKVRNQALPSGLHVINPFAKLHRMTVQTQEVKEIWIKELKCPKELVLSNNLKVLIIGEGLPVILAGDTAEPCAAPTTAATIMHAIQSTFFNR